MSILSEFADSNYSEAKGIIGAKSLSIDSGDAVDVSGSEVTLVDSKVFDTGDKGVSVGERSYVDGARLLVDGGQYGFVSKDCSRVTLTDVVARRVTTAFAAY